MLRTIALILAFSAAFGATAAAQQTAPYKVTGGVQDRVAENHLKCTGGCEFEQGDTALFADEVEIFTDQDRAVARGNVVFSQGNNRIAADSAEFDTRTRLGTFRNAHGIANIRPPRPTRSAGFVAPQLTGQENDVYFFGDVVEKIGPKKYRITNGGFSTCVQPTPRWELAADTIVLNIDHYTLLTQALLKVKGVPLLYVPFLYYPTKEEDRATGILLPTYGTSTLRGQTIHNAFFWAINRSQDATFLYDWFSRTGQGYGGEYRYNMAAGSDGNLTAYTLDQKQSTYVGSNGSTTTLPETRTYELRGGANQLLPFGLRARGRVDYFSSIENLQTFNTNINDASRSQRSYGGNVVGYWRGYSLNGTFDQFENFRNQTNSIVQGSTPRVSITRSERPLFANSPAFFSVGSEFVRLLRQQNVNDQAFDSGLTRVDFNPQIRYPFKKWQWFTVSSSLAWRNTFYTRSQDPVLTDPATGQQLILDESLNRQYFTFQAQSVGPIFVRVFDAPGNGYAERFKHSIEPFLNLSRTTSVSNYARIMKTESIDSEVGSTTRYNYGLNNRFYAKRPVGQTTQAREIVNVSLTQTYYSDPRASQLDPRYGTSFTGAQPSNYSPIQLSVRTTPLDTASASLSAEFDSHHHELRTMSVNGNYTLTNLLQASAGWSRKFFIEGLVGFNNPLALDHYLNGSANIHTRDNRLGGNYSFNYNILRSALLQQRMSAFYNAQCCGIAFEFQRYNFGVGSVLPADHRFFLSVTLAGLGNFSPFNGAMSGVPR
jgi:LPS-assembly protein